mmetsp:Transcript_70433/g.155848  ORF Transcript_70433/g.155848 Transcript_70433/m.155848 type:complete len:262 (+) Transcript_70433:1098-1883(+)
MMLWTAALALGALVAVSSPVVLPSGWLERVRLSFATDGQAIITSAGSAAKASTAARRASGTAKRRKHVGGAPALAPRLPVEASKARRASGWQKAALAGLTASVSASGGTTRLSTTFLSYQSSSARSLGIGIQGAATGVTGAEVSRAPAGRLGMPPCIGDGGFAFPEAIALALATAAAAAASAFAWALAAAAAATSSACVAGGVSGPCGLPPSDSGCNGEVMAPRAKAAAAAAAAPAAAASWGDGGNLALGEGGAAAFRNGA